MPATTARPAATDEPARWVSLTVVSLGLFLAVASTTMVSVALPTLGRDLHAGATDQEWVWLCGLAAVPVTALPTSGKTRSRKASTS